jgi:hypothetical protein
LTLLEMIIASTLMTMVLAAVSVVMRTGRAAWEAHEADFTRLTACHATLRHIVRQVRQAEAVLSVSGPTDNSGSISIRLPNDSALVWDHDAATNRVFFGEGVADSLLAEDISQLNIQAYCADGTTPATSVDQIQCVVVTLAVNLPRDTNPVRTISSWVWIRTW